jgi:hypothetical protein
MGAKGSYTLTIPADVAADAIGRIEHLFIWRGHAVF